MAKLIPVTGYVVKQSVAEQVVSPAYDALTPEERGEYAGLNPLNFLNTMRSAEEYPESEAPSFEELLKINADNLQTLRDENVFEALEKPSFFIYRLSIDDHVQTGIVAEMPIEAYTDNTIRIHENTRASREEQLSRYLYEVGASSSPVCIAYPSNARITAKFAELTETEPALDFMAEDGLHQQLWKIDDEQLVADLEAAFAQVPFVYLTDGHHRCASGQNYANKMAQRGAGLSDPSFTNLLVSIFPDDEMRILAYHRAVRDLGDLTVPEFLEKLDTFFKVNALHVNYADEAEPRKKGEFAMLLDDNWYHLTIRKEFAQDPDPVKSLDVSILEDRLLRPILGIEDMRADPRLDYVPGLNGLRGLEERAEEGWRLMLGCYPTSMEEMYAVADNNRVMPPKSTWFDPKVRSGIFLKLRQH